MKDVTYVVGNIEGCVAWHNERDKYTLVATPKAFDAYRAGRAGLQSITPAGVFRALRKASQAILDYGETVDLNLMGDDDDSAPCADPVVRLALVEDRCATCGTMVFACVPSESESDYESSVWSIHESFMPDDYLVSHLHQQE